MLAAVPVPLLVSYGSAGLMTARIPSLAGYAIGFGVAASIVGLSGAVPTSGPYADVAAVDAGSLVLSLPLLGTGQRLSTLLVGFGALVALACSFGAAGFDLFTSLTDLRLPVIGLAGVVAAVRLASLAGNGTVPITMIAVAALGLGGVASVAPGAFGGAAAVALASGCIGWLLARRGDPIPAVAVLVAGALLIVLAGKLARDALHTPWPMLLLPVSLWGDQIGLWALGLFAKKRARSATPLATAVGAAIPAGLAVALAAFLATVNAQGAS